MKKRICTLLYNLGLWNLAYMVSPSVATYLHAKDMHDIIKALQEIACLARRTSGMEQEE